VSGRELGAAGISVAVLDFETSLNRNGRAEILGLTVQGPGMDLTASGAADLFDAGFVLRDKIRADVTTAGKILPETFLAGMDLAVDPQYLDSVIEFDLKTHADYAMGAAVGMADIKDIVIPQRKLGAKIDLKEKRFSLSIEDLADIGAAWIWKKVRMPRPLISPRAILARFWQLPASPVSALAWTDGSGPREACRLM
jgi:hypothetical protein